jgi:hypothetical protein
MKDRIEKAGGVFEREAHGKALLKDTQTGSHLEIYRDDTIESIRKKMEASRALFKKYEYLNKK